MLFQSSVSKDVCVKIEDHSWFWIFSKHPTSLVQAPYPLNSELSLPLPALIPMGKRTSGGFPGHSLLSSLFKPYLFLEAPFFLFLVPSKSRAWQVSGRRLPNWPCCLCNYSQVALEEHHSSPIHKPLDGKAKKNIASSRGWCSDHHQYGYKKHTGKILQRRLMNQGA